jgi:hypothetical protein
MQNAPIVNSRAESRSANPSQQQAWRMTLQQSNSESFEGWVRFQITQPATAASTKQVNLFR